MTYADRYESERFIATIPTPVVDPNAEVWHMHLAIPLDYQAHEIVEAFTAALEAFVPRQVT